ncbi:T9SS type A sorting domain-containing protein [Marinoscillum sp.]|uniref:T9SS type A sorting domain-containing protein n=1 Tax=Marinoscillum sp. TaxID=2024838 RepID=UPI0038738A59
MDFFDFTFFLSWGGQVVWKFRKAFGRDLIHLDLNDLSSGVYLVYISSEDSIKEVQKLIIK